MNNPHPKSHKIAPTNNSLFSNPTCHTRSKTTHLPAPTLPDLTPPSHYPLARLSTTVDHLTTISALVALLCSAIRRDNSAKSTSAIFWARSAAEEK